MWYKVHRHWMSSSRAEVKARWSRRWLLFTVLSSLALFALAGAIALVAPGYSAISWA